MPQNPESNKPLPMVSIGMPVFNGEAFLCEAIDSLLEQTFTDFELVISDNASTDETQSICRKYASRDSRIRYIRQPENQGALANFQYVLDNSNGQYFMWAAADDLFDREWLDALLPTAILHHCLSFGLVSTIDAAGAKLPHPANSLSLMFTGSRLGRRLKYFTFPGALGKANLIHGLCPTSLLRHPTMVRLETESIAADQIFLYALLNTTDFRHAGSAYLYKRVHEHSAGATVVAKGRSRGIMPRLRAFLKGVLQTPLLCRYMRRSGPFESILIVLCYPVSIMLNTACALYSHFLISRKTSVSGS